MKNIFRYTFRDIAGNLPRIALFAAQCVVCVYFITVMGMYFFYNQSLLQSFQSVARKNITAFESKSVYNVGHLNDQTLNALRKTLAFDGDAYAVVSSAYLPASERPLLIGLGRFYSVFDPGLPAVSSSTEQPILLIGAEVDEMRPGDVLAIGENANTSIAIDGRLGKGYSYMQGTYSVNLDQYVVLLATFKQFEALYPYNVADVITGYHMIDADETQILSWISQMSSNSSCETRSYSLSESALSQYEETSFFLQFYIGVYGSALLLILVGLGISLHQMVDQNMKEYSIHRLYGAPLSHILLRIILYVALIAAIPLALYPAFINRMIFESIIPMRAILLLYVFASACLSFAAVFRLYKNGITGMLRRDY